MTAIGRTPETGARQGKPGMQDRDLILGVLATQAGFVTPKQVMEAAAARLIGSDQQSLLTHLEQAGALTSARRELLEALANEALSARQGNAGDVLASLGGAAAVSQTFGTAVSPTSPARPATADEDRTVPAEREGQYTRLGELGRGGQSVVRRAVDEFVGREVALKELRVSPESPHSSPSDSTAGKRFLREVRLTAQLDHPGIVAVHELARRADGTLFCAQKLIRGETLKARLARCESLRQRLELLPHLIDACDAVAYAHSRGVIHRDLKPSNIMIGAFGETVVVDWGLAKKRGEADEVNASVPGSEPELSVYGAALGTPAYMSPEQARGALSEIDERSDAELRLDDAVHAANFSNDGMRIAVVSFSTISVWALGRSRPLWQIRNFSSVVQEVGWSSDDSALRVLYDSLGTSLLDSATGERFATLTVTKPAAFATQEIVLPSLRYRISRGDGAWEIWPLPAPDDGPPRASLMRVLSEAGLEMRGVELVDAAPSPGAVASSLAKNSALRDNRE